MILDWDNLIKGMVRYDNMGGIDKLLSDIRNQFLYLYDGVLFIVN